MVKGEKEMGRPFFSARLCVLCASALRIASGDCRGYGEREAQLPAQGGAIPSAIWIEEDIIERLENILDRVLRPQKRVPKEPGKHN